MSADQKEDAAKRHLVHSEEYRRARRNVEIWASLAIVACFGKSAADADSAVPLFLLGLAYEPTFVIAACLTATLYMLAAYCRSEDQLQFDHNVLMLGRSANEASEAFDSLASDARKARSTIQGELSRLHSTVAATDIAVGRYANAVEEILMAAAPKADLLPPQHEPPFTPEEHIELLRAALNKQKVEGDAAQSRVRKEAEKARAEQSGFREAADLSADVSLRNIETSIAAAVEATKNLRRFHHSISDISIRWHKWYDKPSVILLCATAVLASLWHIAMLKGCFWVIGAFATASAVGAVIAFLVERFWLDRKTASAF